MGIIERFLGPSPFAFLVEHARKVHECVKLIRPLAEALLAGEWERIDELHHRLSKTEHEADQIKDQIRDRVSRMLLLSVGRLELMQFLGFQDDVADAAEDFAVVLRLRKTPVPEELREDLLAFVDQVVNVSEHLLGLSEELSALAEAGFTGKEAARVIEEIEKIGQEEWKADKLQRRFATHFYKLEDQVGPVDVFFYDKYCHNLSAIANAAERTAKYLRQIIGKH